MHSFTIIIPIKEQINKFLYLLANNTGVVVIKQAIELCNGLEQKRISLL